MGGPWVFQDFESTEWGGRGLKPFDEVESMAEHFEDMK